MHFTLFLLRYFAVCLSHNPYWALINNYSASLNPDCALINNYSASHNPDWALINNYSASHNPYCALINNFVALKRQWGRNICIALNLIH